MDITPARAVDRNVMIGPDEARARKIIGCSIGAATLILARTLHPVAFTLGAGVVLGVQDRSMNQ